MRMMLRVQMATEETNHAIEQGELPNVMRQVSERLHPEAAYFTTQDGERTGYIFFDMKQTEQMPMVAEPMFMKLGAKVELTPAMTMDEVESGLRKAARVM